MARQWSSNLLFLITAIGTEAGIANFWKFTYLAGSNGGGTFVILYFAALALVAVPALMAEMLVGRIGGRSAIGTMQVLAQRFGVSRCWTFFGALALVTVFLILSYYFVVCSWMVRYLWLALSGRFEAMTLDGARETYRHVLENSAGLAIHTGAFILATVVIVGLGVNRGVERMASILTPLRFFILAVLLGFAAIIADMRPAARFLFAFDVSAPTPQVVVVALGQALFSLGVGVGVMLTVGAYMKREYSIAKSVLTVAFAQGLVALIAGFSVFPLVFEYGLAPAQGPGLVFVTLPVAFAQMPQGTLFAVLLFLVLAFAGLTATTVILEALVAYFEEVTRWTRKAIAAALGLALYAASFLTILSFGPWQKVYPLSWLGIASHRTFFELIDALTSNVLMPIGALAVMALAGWALPREVVARELAMGSGLAFRGWRLAVRYLVPAVILIAPLVI